MTHDHFDATTRGIDRDSPAMHLFEKAKRLGVWNPSEIDFSQFDKRYARLAKARDTSLDEVYRVSQTFIAQDDA